jgi:uncharacterized protein
MIHLSSIYFYPCKGLAGISVTQIEVDSFGPKYDRRWMLIDKNNKFLTQRQKPKMVLIRPEIQESCLLFKAPEQRPFEIPLEPESRIETEVNIFGERCTAWETSRDAEIWFSTFLKYPCRPVYMPNTTRRIVDQKFSKFPSRTSFTDGFPFLLIGEASLEDLNQRLQSPVEMRRFRPNLVIQGSHAFEEDIMEWITIGNIMFQVAKRCGRCRVTTVDPEVGEFSGKDPLMTLSNFRSQNGEALFGQNLIHQKNGVLKIGDKLKTIDPDFS